MAKHPRRTGANCLAGAIVAIFMACAGCGTTKFTDTSRSATEQLLITDAMDRAVSRLDFRALAGKTAYIDTTALKKITDWEYLVSCIRQHMLANGCLVMEVKEEAEYVLEVRAGAVGTDRHDLLYGVPSVNVPTVFSGFGLPSQIPEMPIIKKTDQRAVVKVSLFAYNRNTGRPIWQSGAVPEESDAKAVWVLGAGPFQRGKIYDGMTFAGRKIDIPLIDVYRDDPKDVSVADEAYFVEPKAAAVEVAEKPNPPKQPQAAAKPAEPAGGPGVVTAAHTAPTAPAAGSTPGETAPAANPPKADPSGKSPAAAPAPNPPPERKQPLQEAGQAAAGSGELMPEHAASGTPLERSSRLDIQRLLLDPAGPVTVPVIPE
ncbi:MAG: DUF6655 family protein [Thermoguttaceae bacterium]|jgi:hypothetical protein